MVVSNAAAGEKANGSYHRVPRVIPFRRDHSVCSCHEHAGRGRSHTPSFAPADAGKRPSCGSHGSPSANHETQKTEKVQRCRRRTDESPLSPRLSGHAEESDEPTDAEGRSHIGMSEDGSIIPVAPPDRARCGLSPRAGAITPGRQPWPPASSQSRVTHAPHAADAVDP